MALKLVEFVVSNVDNTANLYVSETLPVENRAIKDNISKNVCIRETIDEFKILFSGSGLDIGNLQSGTLLPGKLYYIETPVPPFKNDVDFGKKRYNIDDNNSPYAMLRGYGTNELLHIYRIIKWDPFGIRVSTGYIQIARTLDIIEYENNLYGRQFTHKKIENVRTVIRNKRQLVILEFDSKTRPAIISPQQIKQNTTLGIQELELLIGQRVRIEYYQLGEPMFDGRVCNSDDTLVKEYFFLLEMPVNELRIKHADRKIIFYKIEDLFDFERKGRQVVGIKLIGLDTIFLSRKYFERICDLNSVEKQILKGSFINVEFYQEGDILYNGRRYFNSSSKIVRSIILRYSDTVETMTANLSEFSRNANKKRISQYGQYNGDFIDRYSNYGGPSDGYGGQIDDSFIDDVLGGEPEAYWNLD